MFTTLDLIKDIINNKFIQTNKITKKFINEHVNENDLIPAQYTEWKTKSNFVVRKKFNTFNKDNLKVTKKQITTNDEINKLYFILMYLTENKVQQLIFGHNPVFKVHFGKFFNVKKYETSKEIKYDIYCIFTMTLSGRLWDDIYKLSFVINKDITNLKNILQLDELYEIKEQPPITVNNTMYYSRDIKYY